MHQLVTDILNLRFHVTALAVNAVTSQMGASIKRSDVLSKLAWKTGQKEKQMSPKFN